ncbi:MAG TPA: phage holin family protein [Roseiflexaceae bacterium]|jgi:uncharacterized membrane protein YqjE|nr:phage holin family protein [Roseiflexaceae bacterium]
MTTQREREPSMTQLLEEVSSDLQTLVKQEIALARAELYERFDDAREIGIAFALGGGLLAVGGLLLVLMLAQAIADLFDWPEWAGYAVLGTLFTVVGAIRVYAAQQQARSTEFLPQQTLESVKRDVEAITNRSASGPA